MIKNYMEDLVDSHLKDILEDNKAGYADVCKCEECISAIEAYALNRLKTLYVTTKAGEVYGEYGSRELQERADILKMLAIAIGVVHTTAHKPLMPHPEKQETPQDEALKMFLRSVSAE